MKILLGQIARRDLRLGFILRLSVVDLQHQGLGFWFRFSSMSSSILLLSSLSMRHGSVSYPRQILGQGPSENILQGVHDEAERKLPVPHLLRLSSKACCRTVHRNGSKNYLQ